MRRYPILLAAIAGVVVAGMLPARSHRSAAAAVAYAATRTLDAGSSRVSIAYTDPTIGVGDANVVPFEITGLIDYRRHRGSISLGGEDSRWIFDGRVFYYRIGGWFPGAKPWVRVENDDDTPDAFSVQDQALSSPEHVLSFLRRTSSGVREVGHDEVRGVPTTHFEGTLDLQKIVAEAPSAERAELQAELALIIEDEPKTLSYGIWVDADDVARRLRIDESDGAASNIEFYDFGVPVVLDLPPADQVMESDEYVEAMQKYAREHASSCGDDSSDASQDSDEGSGGISTYQICVSWGGTDTLDGDGD
jgi:hypothetical protein